VDGQARRSVRPEAGRGIGPWVIVGVGPHVMSSLRPSSTSKRRRACQLWKGHPLDYSLTLTLITQHPASHSGQAGPARPFEGGYWLLAQLGLPSLRLFLHVLGSIIADYCDRTAQTARHCIRNDGTAEPELKTLLCDLQKPIDCIPRNRSHLSTRPSTVPVRPPRQQNMISHAKKNHRSAA
jgi:hypothetical protein